jgi:TonB-dependent starch-binding outer membrane protein SusC
MKKQILFFLLFTFSCSVNLLAQDRKVSGRVTAAEDGAGLPGVSVQLKGTNSGTTTDASGNYTIAVPDKGILKFSFIGLVSKEVNITSSSVINVQLISNTQQLSEVVVTGVGTATDKRRLAISVESITSDKLPMVSTASIDQALVGKIAGAQIFSSSGSPGTPVSIQLRGVNTLLGGTGPLIMVDGVEMSSTGLNSIDPSSIERVEVVQGAASATIYGAQGANGVIQIFTKKGKVGKIKIDFSSSVSFDSPLNIGNLRQPQTHAFNTDAQGNILDNSGKIMTQDALGVFTSPTWSLNDPNSNANKPYIGNVKYNDHIASIFRNAKTVNNAIAISGANEKADYSVHLSRLSQESTINGQLDRYNLSANVGVEITDKLSARFVTQLITSNNSTDNTSNSGISSAMYTYPFVDFNFKDADGNSTLRYGVGAGANSSNPLYRFQYQTYSTVGVDVVPSINLNYRPIKFLTLDYKYNINHSREDFIRISRNQEANKLSAKNNYSVGEGLTGGIQQIFTRKTNQNSLFTATINTDFEKDFGLNIPIITTTQIAFDWRKQQFNRSYLNFIGLPPFDYNSVTGKIVVNGAQAQANNASEYEDKFITYGYFVNQRFEYGEIAGISGGFRADYSSVFGDSEAPFFFPRGDAYLRLSKFDFFKNAIPVFNEFKIRAAYGEAGLQPVSYFFDFGATGAPNHYLRTTTLLPGTTNNGGYLAINSTVANPGLKVEISKETEFGVDLDLFPSKSGNWFNNVGASFTAWNRKGTNIVWPSQLAPSSGSNSLQNNYIDLSSRGIQFSVNASIYKSENFKWDFVTAFGTQKTFVDRIADGKELPLNWVSAATYVLKEGEEIGTVYGYKALTSFDQKNPEGKPYLTGDASKYELVDGRVVEKATKNVFFTSDKYALGTTNPDFTSSFTNTLKFKNYLTFSFQFDWISGAKTYNQTKEWMYSEGLHGDYDRPVTINGQTGAWSAYYKSFYDASESNGTKDYFLENSSFVRLRNVSVGFDMVKLFKTKFTDRMLLTVTGRNLLTFTKYTGFDPEASNNVGGNGGASTTAAPQSALQRGLDFWSNPNFSSVQVSLNVGF